MRYLDLSPQEQRLAALDFQNYAGEDPRYARFFKAPVEEAEEYLRKINMPYDEDEDDYATWEDPNVPRLEDNSDRVLSWEELSPPSKYGLSGKSPYFNYDMDTGVLGGWLTEDDPEEQQNAIKYLAAIAKQHGTDALVKRLYADDKFDDEFDDDLSEYTGGLSGMLGPDAVAKVLQAVHRQNTTATKDVNGDGDVDIIMQDTDKNGHPDTAVVLGDTEKETKQGVKEAVNDLKKSHDANTDELTSTGKTKDELKSGDTTSDARQKRIKRMTASWGKTATQRKNDGKQKHSKDCSCYSCQKKREAETVSDFRQKNIIAALKERLY